MPWWQAYGITLLFILVFKYPHLWVLVLMGAFISILAVEWR